MSQINILSIVSSMEHDIEANLDLGLQIDAELRDARAQHVDDVATIERLRAELAVSQARNIILAEENRKLRLEGNPEAIIASHKLNDAMQKNGHPAAAVIIYHHAMDAAGCTYTAIRPDGSRLGLSEKRVEGVVAKLKSRYGSVAYVEGEPPPLPVRNREPPPTDWVNRYLGD